MSAKILLAGATVALVSGVLLGGAMQPNLGAADDGRPAGPQMFASWSGTRSTGPFDPGATFPGDNGKIPDYVMGTDWKKAAAWPDVRAAVSAPEREVVRDDEASAEPVSLARTDYPDPPPPARDYPSLGGAQLSRSDDNAPGIGD